MQIPFGSSAIESDDILLLAEYTTADGPAADDYFLVVITRDGEVHETSIGGPETNDLLLKFSGALRSEFRLNLYNRSDAASRVLYPPNVSERPLFRIQQVKINRSKIGRLLGMRRSIDLWEIDPAVHAEAQQWRKTDRT